jgi:hypothetical protein
VAVSGRPACRGEINQTRRRIPQSIFFYGLWLIFFAVASPLNGANKHRFF